MKSYILYYFYIPRKLKPAFTNMLLKNTVLLTKLNLIFFFLFSFKKKKQKQIPHLIYTVLFIIAYFIYFKEWKISTFQQINFTKFFLKMISRKNLEWIFKYCLYYYTRSDSILLHGCFRTQTSIYIIYIYSIFILLYKYKYIIIYYYHQTSSSNTQ